MSAPTPAPGDDRPREGYYPDPSIPGYVRYWNGASWVPGTSRPAPSDGRPLTPPPGSPPASVEETGPHFFDEDPAPAEPYGGRPEPASAWGADRAHQSGFGGDQDRRVSWGAPQGADPRVPSPAPAQPEGRSTSTDGTSTIPPAEPEDGAGAGDVVSGGTFVFRRPTAGGGAAPAPGASRAPGPVPDEGTVTFRAPAPRTEHQDGASGARPAGNAAAFPAAAQGPGPTQAPGPSGSGGPASAAFGAQGQAGAPADGGTAPAKPGFGAGKAAAERAAAQTPGVPAPQGPAHMAAAAPAPAPAPVPAPAPAPAPVAAPAPAPAAASAPAPQGAAGFPAGQAGAARPGAAQAPAPGSAPFSGPQPGAVPGVPQQSGGPQPQPPQAAAQAAVPMAAGPGGGQPSWAQQVHRLAGAEDGPVAPWKPPVDDIFQAAARRAASARPAGLGKRLAARLVDTLVVAAVTSAAAVPLGAKALDHVTAKVDAAKLTGETVTVWLLDGTTSVYLGIVLAVLLVFGIVYEAVPTAKWGRTLGKKLFGLEVRDIEGGEPPSFGAALRRWLVYSVPGLLVVGVVGVVWGLFDKPWRQCWHDKAAHTFVAG
ncbi:RDD family protein [Streptomyces rishiriensis]|uniref:RDD family membrane protein YckC n=1 Tax=Streptomyces rishiriensis TaxID=68264 RepID=A0ABU0NQ83_STRRH|nr:RDD family protein [Streptomyces rishiriensis]MDQ0581313.1 putative RDD family membrane protein YckC [Streptomyces rishiriensis]